MHKPSLVDISRDGDQFHYLWGARRLLSLLPGRGDLVAVSIEGSSRSELPPDSRDLPGEEKIDVGEYYEAETPRDHAIAAWLTHPCARAIRKFHKQRT
jgi:hypothetical protein